MQKKIMFTIKDVKAESFAAPFLSDNKATAMRDFSTLVRDGRTLVGQHPEDFDLFAIASFDLGSGVIHLFPSFDHVANGSDFLKGASDEVSH